ncbi:hypothetical protein [uncultured Clostridium sp.]|jgi:hypothetical protein|nr:hypothetical protein [uncultured Clostridium sp.]
MDKKVKKDTIVETIWGLLEVTGILGVLLIAVMPVLVIIGLIKRGLRKF